MFRFKLIDFTTILAICAITILEVFAMIHGLNGQAFLTSVGLIAGLAGFRLGRGQKQKSKRGIN